MKPYDCKHGGNAKAQSASTDSMVNRDEPNRTLCAHIFAGKGSQEDLSKKQPTLKGEVKIPPPHPYKINTLIIFPHEGFISHRYC
jgi:hypothetical protein